jgi:hypothetical protein
MKNFIKKLRLLIKHDKNLKTKYKRSLGDLTVLYKFQNILKSN